MSRPRIVVALAAVALLLPNAAAAQIPPESAPPAANPREWRAELASSPSRVLTLGSSHLSRLPEGTPRDWFEPLVERLVAFAPDIVTYEGLSGEQCVMLTENAALYPGVASQYCDDVTDIQRTTGLSVAAASVEIERQLAAWPAAPNTSQRRHLASLFYAANDLPSAYVQWLQLPVTERREGDGVDAALVRIMTRAHGRLNESFDVAAAVAARLGHTRIYAVDDHTADAVQNSNLAQLEAALGRMWASPQADAMRAEDTAMIAGLTDGDRMLRYYRWINSPEIQRAAMDIDHRAAVRATQDALLTRRYTG